MNKKAGDLSTEPYKIRLFVQSEVGVEIFWKVFHLARKKKEKQ